MFVYPLTIIVIIAVFFPLFRLIAAKANFFPESPEGELPSPESDKTQSPTDANTEMANEPYPEVPPPPSRPRRLRGHLYTVFTLLGISLVFCLATGKISLDRLYSKHYKAKSAAAHTPNESSGEDWKVVDGIRWFRVTGTDSAGVGYSGWVSELVFRQNPPESLPAVKGFLEKLGFPSMKERLDAARQMRNISQALQKALGDK